MESLLSKSNADVLEEQNMGNNGFHLPNASDTSRYKKWNYQLQKKIESAHKMYMNAMCSLPEEQETIDGYDTDI